MFARFSFINVASSTRQQPIPVAADGVGAGVLVGPAPTPAPRLAVPRRGTTAPLGRAIAASLAAALLMPVFAHDVFVERVLLIQFGDAGEKLDPYHPDQVTAVHAVGSDGAELQVSLLPIGETGVTIQSPDGDPIAVTVQWDGGYRVQPTPDAKWQKVTKAEAEAAGTYRSSTLVSRRVFAWHPVLSTPTGVGFEIVPLADPASVTVGGRLPVRVLRDGKPLSSVAVRAGAGTDELVTDSEGMALIPLTASGLLFIKARVSDTVGQAEHIHIATLVVTVPGA